jgi:hypothetical protein
MKKSGMKRYCKLASGNGCYYGDRFKGRDAIPGFKWTPDTAIGALSEDHPNFPAMNGGLTGTDETGNITYETQMLGFLKLIETNWKATLKAAETAAEDCQCKCDAVWASFTLFPEIYESGELTLPPDLSLDGMSGLHKRDLFEEIRKKYGTGMTLPKRGSQVTKFPCKKRAANEN